MKEDSSLYQSYVRDLFYLLRESAAEARREKLNGGGRDAYLEGREMAYVEVLLRMQSLADGFEIPRAYLGLADFDPLKDPLEPPYPARSL